MRPNKIRRDVLKRKIEAGKVLAKCLYSLTDDYAFDNANNCGRMKEFKPARIQKDHNDFKDGYVNFGDYIFEFKSLRCYRGENGQASLRIHSNEVYDLKFID